MEQLSFGEFLQYLPTPTCISSVSMQPLDGNAVLELNPSLVAPMIDILLGGSGVLPAGEVRELTEIEQSIAEGLLRGVLHDLREAWAPVAEIDFKAEAIETQPQLMQILSANEAIVAIGFEITLGEARGMMNFGIPSILVKMMGQRFEQQWSMRRRGAGGRDRRKMHTLIRQVPLTLDVRAAGASIRLEDLLALRVGDVVSLETPIERPAVVLVNGLRKFRGEIVAVGGRCGVEVVGPDPAAAEATE